jgi:hypothetical protein
LGWIENLFINYYISLILFLAFSTPHLGGWVVKST